MLVYLQMIESPEEQSLFAQIYEAYNGLLFYIAKGYLDNPMDAEDAVHQAFLYVAENMKKFQDGVCHKTKAYLVKVVESRAIDILRKRKHHLSTEDLEHLEGRMQDYPNLSPLASSMAKLPKRYQDALILRFWYGLEFREIAKMMKVTEVNARRLISRAREKLEQIYKEEAE